MSFVFRYIKHFLFVITFFQRGKGGGGKVQLERQIDKRRERKVQKKIKDSVERERYNI